MKMDNFFPRVLDNFFRRHPIAMSLCLVGVALFAFLLILAQSGKAVVLYAGF
jgi:hypothetical protein